MVLQKFAGYSLKTPTRIRKAMSKKIAALMQAEGEKFIAASVERTATRRRKREAIFQLIEPFAGYAFNKAHSAVYGTIAYQTAYLKANYPHEYMTAVLSQRRHARAHRRGRRGVRAPRHRGPAAGRQPRAASDFELRGHVADGAERRSSASGWRT